LRVSKTIPLQIVQLFLDKAYFWQFPSRQSLF